MLAGQGQNKFFVSVIKTIQTNGIITITVRLQQN